jgi:hypothetical protein
MKLTANQLPGHFITSAAATASELSQIDRFFNYAFPIDYKDFLQITNGLEGNADKGYLVIWSIEELLELNTAYQVKEFASHLILFGSDGGEDAFAFDTSGPAVSIVKLPFIGMGYVPNHKLANSFQEFLSLFGFK